MMTSEEDSRAARTPRRWYSALSKRTTAALDTRAIDRSYMPTARGRPDLEAELRTMRGTIQQHPTAAERIRDSWR